MGGFLAGPTASTPAARRRRFRVAAVAASAVLTVVVIEAAFAAFDLPTPVVRWPEGVAESRDIVDPRAYVVDPVLLWRLRREETLDFPDLGLSGVRTNARGLRGADRDEEVRASRLRVLCLGDSVTFGFGLRDDETYPVRLEAALRTRFGPDVAPVVVNAGVPGYSSVQGMRLLDELKPLDPDVVVWWFGMNDGKPALGRRDAELRTDVPAGGGALALLDGLRTVRFAKSLGEDLRPSATRVSEAEVRAIVSQLSDGGRRATTLFVKCPSRLGEKSAQLDRIAAGARRGRAAWIDGAQDALSPFVPGAPACEEVRRMDHGPDGRIAVLGDGRYGRATIDLPELDRRRDAVAAWKKAVDGYVAAMPADALDYRALFGDAPASAAMSDNCHMTPDSTRWAADAVASRIAEIVARRGGPRRR